MPASIWNAKIGSADYDAEQAARVAVFNKIAPAGNWKAAIDCWVDASELDDANSAAIWFTGGPLTVIGVSFAKVHVQGAGYYQNVGA